MTSDNKARSEQHSVMERAAMEPTTATRGKCLRELVEDCVQAHRGWASELEEQALTIGYRTLAKDWLKANCAMPVASKSGGTHDVAGMRGVQRDEQWTQVPLDGMTWAEVREVADRDERQAISLHVNAAALRKLLALQTKYPRSKGPAEACAKAKTSVAAYLAAVTEAA